MLAGNLSGGEQQILETAMVLEASPQLLLLDEPSLGLSPGNQDQIFEMIAQLRDGGLTVLVVEQNAHGALQISDTGIVMELGRLFMVGPAAEVPPIRASPPISAATFKTTSSVTHDTRPSRHRHRRHLHGFCH